MNGLELARGYYEDYGKPMLETDFAELMPYLAIGFVGSGSEHYGFDDDISRDHDYEPGFCIFLPGEDVVDRRQAFKLERAYARLPKEYGGVSRQPLSPVGGNRHGVIRTADFYTEKVGAPDGELSMEQWLRVPDYALAEAVNGEVFLDAYGEFSWIRESLCHMPEDIRRKRLAGNLLVMAQAGQYNYVRCLRHGEPEAAQLACTEFVQATMRVTFLLHDRYMPYYKWSFRALRQLDGAAELADQLSSLLFGDRPDDASAERKYDTVEGISTRIITELQEMGLSKAICGDLEKHAYAVNDTIRDSTVRNMHILAAI